MEYQKCKYVVLKYVWDNWDNNLLTEGKKDFLREMFSDNLEDLFEDLGKLFIDYDVFTLPKKKSTDKTSKLKWNCVTYVQPNCSSRNHG